VTASVGSQCLDCVRAARPPAAERARRWNATHPRLLTQIIVAINVAVFLAGLGNGDILNGSSTLARRFALDGPDVANGEWYRIITAGFLHYGLIHIAFNMIFIWQLGGMLETSLGRLRYGLLYVASLLAGSAGALLLSPNALTAGASGAAFGLLGATMVGLRQRGVNVWRTDLGMLLIVNLALTFGISGISIGGHLGGLVGGGIAGAALLAPRQSEQRALEIAVPIAVMAASVVVALWAAR
jgi:membrane associated rhomboid family serine protease